jgi:hypothetical protein
MISDIQIIDPTKYKGWDDLILSHPDYSFFHSAAWARVLCDTYQYTPLYFTLIDNGKLLALIPVMEANSYLTGRRGVSLPFTDYCEPLITHGIQFSSVFQNIIDYGKRRKWRYLELRGGNTHLPFAMTATSYYGHILDLDEGAEDVFSRFRGSTRRNIRKAEREGVNVAILTSLDSVSEFYKLHCLTRRKHGLPPQPYRFFNNIHRDVISKGLGFVALVSYRNEYIAGAMFFHFGQAAFYKYAASDCQHQHLRPNNLIIWEAIKRYSKNGYKTLCFGRTDIENQGLIRFKSGCGTTEQKIAYYRYDCRKETFISAQSRVAGFYNKIFTKMPIPLLKTVGSVLYKHIG